MAYPYIINWYEFTKDKFSISFPLDQYSTYSTREKPPKGLLETKGILEFLGLKYGDEFAVDNNKIIIAGRANVITTLNMLLTRKDVFHFSHMNETMGSHDYWCRRVTSLAVEAMCDKALTQGDSEKLRPITQQFLDASFENLKKTELYKTIAANVKLDYGHDFLKHPLYQALSLLMDDKVKRVADYKALSFFQRKKAQNPEKAGYDEIFKGFKVAVPSVYKSTKGLGYDAETYVDADKIRQSREVLVKRNVQGYGIK